MTEFINLKLLAAAEQGFSKAAIDVKEAEEEEAITVLKRGGYGIEAIRHDRGYSIIVTSF